MHYVVDKATQTPTGPVNEYYYTDAEGNNSLISRGKFDDNLWADYPMAEQYMQDGNKYYYRNPVDSSQTLAPKSIQPAQEDNAELTPKHSLEWLRYAGIAGPALGLLGQAFGVGKPDHADLDASVAASNVVPIKAKYRPIGHYLAYNPFDTNYITNMLQGNSRATDRALANQSAGNRGTKMMGLIANGYNTQNALADAYRQAQ